ncbi:uncharacterized protein LOC110461070 [Mizuhopecten yessoensis]|uniref:uncharacterized protein LOC110461070 n=1 Tax=Mizuhopecten yessoensis TaxID=6573 RepID=UPI000B45B02A|nr:uncharacterized protein LOC110461070 [Mizuhopecten yessoensis]
MLKGFLNSWIWNGELRLTTYAQRTSDVNGVSRELRGQLTEFETHLLERQEVVVIRGKTGKGVPVILPPDVLNCMQYLANPAARAITTTKENPYLFANTNIGVYRAYDAIRMVTMNAGLKMPHLIRTSNMRKYFATMLQVFNTTETERQWVLDHLGHTMDVHRVHYRQTSDIIERVDIAKLLMIQDMGLVGRFKGKKLEEIQFNDLLDESEPTESSHSSTSNTRPEELVSSPQAASSTSSSVGPTAIMDEDYIPLEEEEEEVEEMEWLESSSKRKPKRQKRRQKPATKRQRWSEEEEEEIRLLFEKNFQTNACPGYTQIAACIRVSVKKNGQIHKRTKDNIKKKVSAMLIKQRNKQ